MPHYVQYTPEVETVEAGEQETFAKIVDMMTDEMHMVREKSGKNVRPSHAKAFAAVRGTLTVETGLPEYLAQGLFAKPGTYDVIVRMATAPGEYTDDSKLSTARGLSIKVFGAGEEFGPHLAPFEGTTTQDFVLDTGKEFITSTAATFLQAFKPNADIAPKLSDTTKGVVSDIARGTNAVLNMFGMDSQKLDFYGHKKVHPLAEDYFSQTPSRYGNYIAKFGAFASSPGMLALREQNYDPKEYESLREDCVKFFRTNPAEFDFKVQLNTSLDDMKIEDAMSKWSEDESPYQTVAKLTIPVQDAYAAKPSETAEELSFNLAHTLEAFRPLGSINRSRLAAYTALAQTRREENGFSTTEPTSDPLK